MSSEKELRKLRKLNEMEERKVQMELRSKHVALMGRIHQERQETALENRLARAQEAQGWRANELKQEDELAYHLDLSKREEICKLKERQQLWEMRELVDLKTQIRNAYFTKALHCQLSESRAAHVKDRSELEEHKMNMQKEEEENRKREAEIQRMNEWRKRQYRNDLQDQIIHGHKKKIQEHEQRLLDMQLVDDAIRTVIYEDKQQEEELKRRREVAKQEHEANIKAKQVWIELEKHKEEEEDRKVQEYLCKKFEMERRLQEMNRKKADEKMAAQEKLLNRIQELKAGREERERIAQILCAEETRLREEQEMKKKQEEALRRAQEMKETVEGLLREKLARTEEEKKLNKIYRDKLIEEIRAAKQAEIEDIEKEREKKKQYGAELRAGMELMYRNRAEDKFQAAVEQAAIEREQKELQNKIAEERRRIINEHGPQLYGYLPKNVISKEDLPHLHPNKVKLLRDTVKLYMKKTEQSLQYEQDLAIQLVQRGLRNRAKCILRKQMVLSEHLKTTDHQLETLEAMINALETTGLQSKIFEGLKAGNLALKRAYEVLNIKNVELILEETIRAIEKQEEINRMIQDLKVSKSEDALDSELDQELDNLASKTGQVVLKSSNAVHERNDKILSELAKMTPFKKKQKDAGLVIPKASTSFSLKEKIKSKKSTKKSSAALSVNKPREAGIAIYN